MKSSLYHSLAWIDDELKALDENGLRRELVTHDGAQQVVLEQGGQPLLNFGSNDYLAMAADPRLADAAAQASRQEGWGAGASPLVTGHGASHRRLEQRLAEFEATEAALLFTSGYAANVGTLAAIAGPDDVVLSDAKNHASIIDGCRLSRASVSVYRHCDMQDLELLLKSSRVDRRRIIVSEALFSMDGDLAPLADLAALADRYECMLMIDEAHATGVFGEQGRGVAEALGVHDRIDIRVGTLSKALGSAGGFVCGTKSLIDWLSNRARTYVFSTATPPALAAAALAALDLVRDERERRTGLLDRASDLRLRLRADGWNLGTSESQIIPLVIGDPIEVTQLASRLRALGLLVPAIRPPSVPAGESLLRISLTAGHTPAMIETLVESLGRVH